MGGFSKSQQRSRTRSFSNQDSRTFVDPRQQQFLDFMRLQGTALASNQQGRIGSVADQLSGELGGRGRGLLDTIQQFSTASVPSTQDAIGQLLNVGDGGVTSSLAGVPSADLARIAGGGAVDALLTPGAQLEGQTGALSDAIQRNLEQTLGTLGSQATLAGQTGGDRQAMFAGQLGEEALRSFERGAGDLFASDLASRRGLAADVLGIEAGAAGALQQGGLQEAGILASLLGLQTGAAGTAGQLGLAERGSQLGAATAGGGFLPTLMNLGLSPFQAEFGPLLALSSIIGAPTTLSTQRGRSVSRSRSRGDAIAASVGIGGGGGGGGGG